MSLQPQAKAALALQKRQSVRETRGKLKAALDRLVSGNPQVVKPGTKISAASVAKEAGVNRVTLYRFHEPVLVEIHQINDSSPKALLKEHRSDLADALARQKEYRKLAEDAQQEVVALARINYRLHARIKELEELLLIRDAKILEFLQQLNTVDSSTKTVRINRPNSEMGTR